MKKLYSTLFLLLMCFAVQAGGGNDKYIAAMKSALATMDTATTVATLQNCANKFERIGNAEKKEWLPFYYTALSYNLMTYMPIEAELKDGILDKAETFLKQASESKIKDKDRAELVLLQGLIYSNRIGVDPATRGMQYGPLVGQTYGRAARMDPDNPRVTYSQGMQAMFTPEQWGGGKDKAEALLAESLEKFDAWKSPSDLHPGWGAKDAGYFLGLLRSGEPMPWEQAPEPEPESEPAPEIELEAPAPEEDN